MNERESELQEMMAIVLELKHELGPTFNEADKAVQSKVKGSLSINKIRLELGELAARHLITIEEKEPDKGGWILS